MTKKQLEVELELVQNSLSALDSQNQRLIVQNDQLWEEAKKQEKYANIDLCDARKANQQKDIYKYTAAILLVPWVILIAYWVY